MMIITNEFMERGRKFYRYQLNTPLWGWISGSCTNFDLTNEQRMRIENCKTEFSHFVRHLSVIIQSMSPSSCFWKINLPCRFIFNRVIRTHLRYELRFLESPLHWSPKQPQCRNRRISGHLFWLVFSFHLKFPAHFFILTSTPASPASPTITTSPTPSTITASNEATMMMTARISTSTVPSVIRNSTRCTVTAISALPIINLAQFKKEVTRRRIVLRYTCIIRIVSRGLAATATHFICFTQDLLPRQDLFEERGSISWRRIMYDEEV